MFGCHSDHVCLVNSTRLNVKMMHLGNGFVFKRKAKNWFWIPKLHLMICSVINNKMTKKKKNSLLGFFLCRLSDDVSAFYECVWLFMFLNGDTFSPGKHVWMIKCCHGAHALNIHVHVTHQCGTHKNLWCGVCTCILVWICACVPVSLADSSGRLEIKTLCGTWLVIRWELKQKAEESTGKKKKRRAERSKIKWERGRSVLSERGRRERVPLLQSYSLCLGCLFIRIPDRPFPRWLSTVSSLFKCEWNWENRWRRGNMWVTSKRRTGECIHVHTTTCT